MGMLPWSLLLPRFFFEDEPDVIPVPVASVPVTPESPAVATAVAALTPQPFVLDRLLPVNGQDALSSPLEQLAATLTGDDDALYYLILLGVQRSLRLTRQLVANEASLQAVIADIKRPGGTTLQTTAPLLDALTLPISTPAERDYLAAQLTRLAGQYAQSIKDQRGVTAIRPDRATSLDALLSTLEAHVLAADQLAVLLKNLPNVQDVYGRLDVTAAPFARQLQVGRLQLAARSALGRPADTAVDALVLASMLTSHQNPARLNGRKYAGAVVPADMTPAVLRGATVPFLRPSETVSAAGSVRVSVGSTSSTLTAEEGVVPSLDLGPLGTFAVTESGTLATYAQATPWGPSPQRTFKLKNRVAPGSLRLQYQSWAPGGVVTLEDVSTGDVGTITGTRLSGTITYSTGVLTLTTAGDWSSMSGSLTCQYAYQPYATLSEVPFLGDVISSFNTMTVISANTHVTRILPAATYASAADVLAAIQTAFAGTGVTFTLTNGRLVATGQWGGSAFTLLTPTEQPGVLNSAFGYPTWSTAPTTLVGALGATGRFAQGRDAGLAELAGVEALAATVTAPETVLASRLAATVVYTSATAVPTLVGEAGDVVRVTAPYEARHLVTAVQDGVATVTPPICMMEGASANITYDVVRARLLITATSTDDTIATSTPVGSALGLSGSALPVAASFALSALPSTTQIRPGDLLVLGGEVVTDVAKVVGNVVTLSDPSAVPSDTGTLSVYGLGWTSYAALKSQLHTIVWGTLTDGTFPKAAALYGYSNVDQPGYATALQRFDSAAQQLTSALEAYQANRVAAVDALLTYLKEERFTGMLAALADLDMQAAFQADTATQSSTSRADDILQELLSALSTITDAYSITTGQPTNDYLDRPKTALPIILG